MQFPARMHRSIRPAPLLAAAFLAAGFVVAVNGPARAQTAGQEARDQYQSDLAQQCPEKQLQMLSERQLRDGLDDYKGGVAQQLHDSMQQAEMAQCASMAAGVDCVNTADMEAAGQAGQMASLASSICSDFLRCTDQGQCDYAR